MTALKRFCVLGGGSWGLAIAKVLAEAGNDVLVQCRTKEQAHSLAQTAQDPRLAGVTLPPQISYSDLSSQAREGAQVIVLACPSKALKQTLAALDQAGAPSSNCIVVSLIKGIDKDSLKRPSQIIEENLSWVNRNQIAVLSGPSLAKETALGHLTSVVIASAFLPLATQLQKSFATQTFRVYTSDDVLGVEIGGALKNVVALATGMIDGLGLGDNTVGALVTRGLAEMSRLGERLGGSIHTFSGLSGMGDLVTTCASSQSRNRQVGRAIGQGKKLSEVLENLGMVAEGVYTVEAAVKMAEAFEVEMPISQAVYRILYEGQSPMEEAKSLMSRDMKSEWI